MNKILIALLVIPTSLLASDCVEKEYYSSGELQYANECVNGRKHGLQTTYNKDGSMSITANYKNGVLHGELIYYKSDGEGVAFKEMYDDGFMKVSELYAYDNGALSQKTFYKKGSGNYTEERYSIDGVLLRKSDFKNYVLDGECNFYTSDGKKEYDVYFKSGEVVKGYKYIGQEKQEMQIDNLNKLLIDLKIMIEPGSEC